jgi:transposase
MPSALSVDLRVRVVFAIEAGASRRQAAKRFGIGAASAIRWRERYRQDGQIAPKPMGGDRNSQRLEAQAALIVRTCPTSAPVGQIEGLHERRMAGSS